MASMLDPEMAAVSSAGKASKHIPWVEKYRPEKVDDVAHQDECVQTLKKSIEIGNLPHLLFHGPPGTGKTTTILAVARALYGPELYRSRILELNASDERGISVVREKIKIFAQGAVSGQKTPGYPCPRFKLIILDEADTMTPEAQSALRRIIEAYSKVTRFCLICNYVTRVIEPLASRCAKFRFKPLPIDSMKSRMHSIAAAERVDISETTLEFILRASGGDMRKAVTFLQSCQQLCGTNFTITDESVMDIAGLVPTTIMSQLWLAMAGPSFDAMKEAVTEITLQGFPMSSVLSQLHDEVVVHTALSDLDKALVCEKIANADQCLADGSNEGIQFLDVAAFIMRRFSHMEACADTNKVTH